MAAVLFLYWRWLSATPTRRAGLRAHPAAPPQWRWALLAFAFEFAAINANKVVLNTSLDLAVSAPPAISHLPLISLVAYVLMLSLVAAVTEEADFRGFMQGPLERSHGPLIAILVGGLAFWIGHIGQFGGNLRLFALSAWYFLSTSALMGLIAWLTDSILPALAAHFLGDFFYTLLALWASARGFHLDKAPPVSPGFYWAVAIALLGVPLTIWALRRLAAHRTLRSPATLQRGSAARSAFA